MNTRGYAIQSVTPIIRIFDESKAREFYVDFLGFQVDWEHRFEVSMPLYMQISQGSLIIHLSEHYGDCSPGASLRIEVENVKVYHQFLSDQKYKYARPGLNREWGCDEICVTDPFGNKLTFYERMVADV